MTTAVSTVVVTDHSAHGKRCLYKGMRTVNGFDSYSEERVVDILNEDQIQRLHNNPEIKLHIVDDADRTNHSSPLPLRHCCTRSVLGTCNPAMGVHYERASYGSLVAC